MTQVYVKSVCILLRSTQLPSSSRTVLLRAWYNVGTWTLWSSVTCTNFLFVQCTTHEEDDIITIKSEIEKRVSDLCKCCISTAKCTHLSQFAWNAAWAKYAREDQCTAMGWALTTVFLKKKGVNAHPLYCLKVPHTALTPVLYGTNQTFFCLCWEWE